MRIYEGFSNIGLIHICIRMEVLYCFRYIIDKMIAIFPYKPFKWYTNVIFSRIKTNFKTSLNNLKVVCINYIIFEMWYRIRMY